jgi:hypothetical protein
MNLGLPAGLAKKLKDVGDVMMDISSPFITLNTSIDKT